MTYDEILQQMASANVTRPEPVLNTDKIAEINAEINGLQSGTIQRTGTKQEYLEYLEGLRSELATLREQDTAARQAAEEEYQALIEAEKLKSDVIAEAEKQVFETDYKTRLAAIEQAILDLGEALL